MKKLLITALILLTSLIGTTTLTAATRPLPFTTIRGGVYEDVDGRGQCQPGQRPVADVRVSFSQGDIRLSLLSGSNGTFGLVRVGEGTWTVAVEPSAGWRVTSSPTQTARVSASGSRIVTGINFCLQRTGSDAAASTGGSGGDLIARLVAQNLVLPPDSDTSQEAAQVRGVISEVLLTDPQPAPESEVREMAQGLDPQPAPSGEPWLDYLNNFRRMSELQPFAENAALSEGAQLHSRYMVVADRPIAHNQDPSSPLFTPNGNQAAINSDIFATTQLNATYKWAINFWVSAPFHLIPVIDPALNEVGYGQTIQDIGTFKMAAALDVLSARGPDQAGVAYPIMYPANDSQTWVVRHSLYEWPDPLRSCPGFTRPTGAAIVIQVGDGSGTPRVNRAEVTANGQRQDICVFTESTYTNRDGAAQRTGRIILDERDAVVIMPRNPIGINQTVNVNIEIDGQSYAWQFETIPAP